LFFTARLKASLTEANLTVSVRPWAATLKKNVLTSSNQANIGFIVIIIRNCSVSQANGQAISALKINKATEKAKAERRKVKAERQKAKVKSFGL
jgi:uncharacterized membrane protein